MIGRRNQLIDNMSGINPYRLKISQLRALVAIAETGTFSDAALQLDLSQSAVSHAIATLEDELGVVLFTRSRQGALLTPLGQEITAEAHRMMQSLATIGQLAQRARGLQQGIVRIAGFRSVATHILPEVIHQFRRDYTGLQVSIEESPNHHQVEQAVRQGQADIGFTYLPTSSDFEAWELLRDRYILLAPLTDQAPQGVCTWADIAKQPLILAPPEDGCREILQQHLAAAGQDIKPAYEVREDSTILSMVQQGLGVTIMAHLAAEPIPPNLAVAELPMPIERVIGVIQLREALQPPPVYAFMETLKTVWQQSQREMQPVVWFS
ncbi:MAG: LysR family transcriptional regulator [Cyanobacteria bacterium P01_C01_bin.120]